ncbi:MAG: hypothetical protein E7318_00680 [Clostridiales bacterium]|nr:hypothetical protein [Clostridiales bacterium]
MREGPFEKKFFAPPPRGIAAPTAPGTAQAPGAPLRPGTPPPAPAGPPQHIHTPGQNANPAPPRAPAGRPWHTACTPRGVSDPYS